MANFAIGMGGTSADVSNGISVDTSAGSYITGYFQGTSDFDPGAGTSNLTSAGSTDIYLAKYDGSGNLVFAKQLSGTSANVGTAIQTDSSGNSYLTGYFQGTADFDPGAGTTNLTSAGANDIFIAKYDSSGNLAWANQIGNAANDFGRSIGIDSSGNSYITGTFRGTVDFDPGAGTTNLTATGTEDAFFAKYDSSGALVFARQLGGTSFVGGKRISVDASGNSYVAGYFRDTTDFDPGAGTSNLTSAGLHDIFFGKYDTSGNLTFVQGFGGTGVDVAEAFTVDSSGNSYVAGYFQNTVDFDPGAGTTNFTSAGGDDGFFGKYDTSGNLIWVNQLAGTSTQTVLSITVDSGGNSYITGKFRDTVDFDPGAGTTNLTSAGQDDIFIAKYDSSGNLSWAHGFGDTGNDIGYGIRVDSAGTSYITGTFEGTVDFNPGSGTENLTASNTDFFILTLDSNGDFQAVATTSSSDSGGTTLASGSILSSAAELANVAEGRTNKLTLNLSNDDWNGNANLALSTPTGSIIESLFVNFPTIISAAGGASALTLPEFGEIETTYADVSNILTGSAPVSLTMTDNSVNLQITGDGWVNVNGSAIANSIVGNDLLNALIGQGGDDIISGAAGNDLIYGNQGADSIWGGTDQDGVFAGQSDDLVYGNQSADTLFGNLGDDTLFGGQDNDVLNGQGGADALAGNRGNDTLAGGGGADIFIFGDDSGGDTISDFSTDDGDRVSLQVGLNGSTISSALDALALLSSDGSGNAQIDFGNRHSITLTGVDVSSLTAAQFEVF